MTVRATWWTPRSDGTDGLLRATWAPALFVDEPVQGVSEIATKVGLHKSTVSRIPDTLELEKLAERDTTTRKFRLSPGVIALAGPLLAKPDVRRVAYPVLVELSRRTSERSNSQL